MAKTVTEQFTTRHWLTLRLKQMLAQLGYLPLKWAPQDPDAMEPDNVPTELSAMYSPLAGTFTWKKGYPSVLTSFWGGRSSLIMQGAIRAFQANHGLTMTGVMTPALWRDVISAAAANKKNPNGYTYALASKAYPETLTVWHDGRVILHTLANTGIPAAPTADGTFPVYLRYSFQIMSGTNPDGSTLRRPGLLGRLLQRRRRGALLPARLLRRAAEPGLRRAAVRPGSLRVALPDLRHPRHRQVAGSPPERAGAISRRGYGRASIASEAGAMAPLANYPGSPPCRPSSFTSPSPVASTWWTRALRPVTRSG